MIANNCVELVGNTPLIKLKEASEITGCTILGKAEFLNPGQSVKDRAALSIIRDAENKGLLNPGGLIVEGTAGNIGIGLTLVGQALGYKTLIVMPETQSEEKKSELKNMGAELILVPALPYSDPGNYIRTSGTIAKERGGYWANQFDNIANKMAHVEGTAQEIWRQTDQSVDYFVSAIGTGGTISGTSEGLKSKNKNIKVICSDPPGSGMFSWIKNGEPKAEGNSITEGIGQSRITLNLKNSLIDDAVQVSDEEALNVIYNLLQKEGLSLGPSSGVNIAGSIKLGKKVGPGKIIVTILCDYGIRYSSKIYNIEFLKSKNLPIPGWL